jgi:hypothetical protein
MQQLLATVVMEGSGQGGDLQKVVFVPGEVKLVHLQAWIALLLPWSCGTWRSRPCLSPKIKTV